MSTGWQATDIPDETGRTILVTGANSGLGLRSSEALARAGARVLMACRNATKAEDAAASVQSVATGPPPEVVALDLADLASVRACAEKVTALVPDGLHVLMNNAGVMALPETRTADGFEMQLGTNHLGHFALTGLLLPTLLRAGAPRVVTTTSLMHRTGRMRWKDLNWDRRYQKWMAYGQSKLANLLFTFELDRWAQAEGTELIATSAHPGYAATHLQAAGPEMAGSRFRVRVMAAGNRLVAQSDAAGALPQLYAATMPDAKGSQVFGPDGLFQRAGSPRRVGTSSKSKKVEDARRLWEVSEELTGVHYDWSVAS